MLYNSNPSILSPGYIYSADTGFYYLQSRYYDPATARFINADIYTSTGQGVLGHNMFAYCKNNPVNNYDKSGKRSDSIYGWIGEEIGELIYEWITEDDHPNDQAEAIENEIISSQNEMIASAAKAIWDTCMFSYNREQAAILRQAQMNIDMFDSPEDIERSIDIIEATAGFSTAVYEVGLIIISPTPVSVKAVAITAVGVIWGIRGIKRACQ